jgi:hypothetical protein
MSDATMDRAAESPQPEFEHHEYHSAVEVDETVGSWKDWVGPSLAVIGLLAALVVIVMMLSGVAI